MHVERSGRENRTTTLQKEMDDASRDDRGKYQSRAVHRASKLYNSVFPILIQKIHLVLLINDSKF